MPNHVQTAHTVPRLLKDLNRLRALALAIPQPDGSIVAPANDHTAIFAAQIYAVDAAEVSAPPFQCSRCSYVPEKDLLVAADTGESGIVLGDG